MTDIERRLTRHPRYVEPAWPVEETIAAAHEGWPLSLLLVIAAFQFGWSIFG
jgi:hypothetical protein